MVDTQSRAVVLLSGGLDSATTAAIAKADGFALLALTVAYGQRHAIEAEAARRVARAIGAEEHLTMTLDLRAFGGSALTAELDVPKSRTISEMSTGIPITYVPARNTILLSLALAFAETRNASDIFIGVNAIDYSGYPDCRPAFVQAFERLARVATRYGIEGAPVTIHAPLLEMDKPAIIRKGAELGVDYALTHSCYDPSEDGAACGACDSCVLRRDGFHRAGIADPTRYRAPA